MKVISLLQPFATLVVIGAKKIETRSWNTKHRGEILIHASAGKKKEYKDLCTDLSLPFRKHIEDFDKLPFGAIIGSAEIVSTGFTQTIRHDLIYLGNAEENADEIAFGDYRNGRFAWKLRNAIQFPVPIPCKGSLGLWDFDYKIQNVQVSDTTGDATCTTAGNKIIPQ